MMAPERQIYVCESQCSFIRSYFAKDLHANMRSCFVNLADEIAMIIAKIIGVTTCNLLIADFS